MATAADAVPGSAPNEMFKSLRVLNRFRGEDVVVDGVTYNEVIEDVVVPGNRGRTPIHFLNAYIDQVSANYEFYAFFNGQRFGGSELGVLDTTSFNPGIDQGLRRAALGPEQDLRFPHYVMSLNLARIDCFELDCFRATDYIVRVRRYERDNLLV